MNKKDLDISEQNFSDDPTENLRTENEIIKLKLQAQFGAITGGPEVYFPPAVENQFLQSVLRFEEAWQDIKFIKVYDVLGRPDFQKSENLLPHEVEAELIRLKNLLEQKDIFLEVLGKYEPTIIYSFITEELFEQETEDIQLQGFRKTFIYEEFHPNHKLDIEDTAKEFLKNWFEKEFDEYSLEFNNEMITADGKKFTIDETISKLNHVLAGYVSLSYEDYKIVETTFEWNAAENRGMGCTEGSVEYSAELQIGETAYFNGPFKFYMCSKNGYWNIFYFVFPGFEW